MAVVIIACCISKDGEWSGAFNVKFISVSESKLYTADFLIQVGPDIYV